MIEANDLRPGTVFELDGDLFEVLTYQHQKLGRGGATVKTKLKNLRTGSTIDRTFASNDRLADVRLESREVQFLYQDGDLYYFMDTETYDQPVLSREALGDAVNYLKENMTLQLAMHEGEAIRIELPTTVDLEVVKTPPAFKGDTASGSTKKATLETGIVVDVPFFIEQGDVVRVDTRTNAYVTRVSN
ncbi:MAG: elongation factor P [Chloroflexi bacterium]|nr:MAG: elongation factor P [Chloroflexota bacterium]